LGIKKGTMSMTGSDLPSILPKLLPRLSAFALRIAGDKFDAEDLMQSACVRALERSHQLRPDTSPLNWMFSIVRSIWRNELRARGVRARSSIDWNDSILENVPDPHAQTLEINLMSRQLVSAVDRLPKAQRCVVLLVAVEGFSYSEAAEVLQVPIGTVMSRLARARQTVGADLGVRDSTE
jgi:RNA polymerase sigma-70 factor, ECF subfamily